MLGARNWSSNENIKLRFRTAGSTTPAKGAAEYVRVDYQDAPLRLFHLRVAVAATGGVFSDGFGLGIIGIAARAASTSLNLGPISLGLIGGSSLAGLFVGALLTGPLADRFGRQPIFAYNMAFLAVFSLLQFFVSTATELIAIRLVVGLLLGTDYVVSKALLAEFSPRIHRPRIMGALPIAWAAGYACAYFTGYEFHDSGPDSWRWTLLSSAIPALMVLPLRLATPESPMWLADHNHEGRAARVVHGAIGADVAPPQKSISAVRTQLAWQQLFASPYRRRTLVACVFFTCQVIPYFAVGTFIPQILSALDVKSSYFGSLVYNALLLIGAVLGVIVVGRISRRRFLVGSFAISSITMLILSLWSAPHIIFTIVLFALFASVLSAAQTLVYVYLPELFPTDLRASGIGLAVATSRIGSAVSTFLLPILVAHAGVRPTLAGCAAILGTGGLLCLVFAPETKDMQLSGVVGMPRA